MAETVVLKVAMSCQGCAGAVRRVLDKMEGVESYDINLEQKKVTVKGTVQPEVVLQTVSKTGKKTAFWEADEPSETEAKAVVVETKATEAVVEVKTKATEPVVEVETKATEAVAVP